MAEGVELTLADSAADRAFFFDRAFGLATGLDFSALHFGKHMVVFVRHKVRGDHHAACIGVAWHREGEAGAAARRADRSRPVVKPPSAGGGCCYGGAGPAFFDHLAAGAADRAVAVDNKLDRHLCAAHGDRVGGDQPQRYAGRFGDRAQRLRAAVFREQGVGAHILEISGHSLFGKVHAVRKSVVLFGPAGGLVAQNFGRIEELIAVFFAQFDKRRVVGVHLGHRQVGVFPLLVKRRDGADDQVRIRPGVGDGFEPLLIAGNKLRGVGRGAFQVVCPETDNDALRLEFGDGVGDRIHLAVALELFALKRGDIANAHTYHADVVFKACKRRAGLVGVHHVAHGVGIPDEQGLLYIAAPGVRCFGQNGRRLGGRGCLHDRQSGCFCGLRRFRRLCGLCRGRRQVDRLLAPAPGKRQAQQRRSGPGRQTNGSVHSVFPPWSVKDIKLISSDIKCRNRKR